MFNGRRFARFTFTPPAGTLFQPSSLTGWKNASNTVRCACLSTMRNPTISPHSGVGPVTHNRSHNTLSLMPSPLLDIQARDYRKVHKYNPWRH